MLRMHERTLPQTLWDSKAVLTTAVLLSVLLAFVLSRAVTPVYGAESILFVSVPASKQTFDTVQASQSLARSFADVLESPVFADRVARRLASVTAQRELAAAFANPSRKPPPKIPGSDLRKRTTIEPLPETQLLKIESEAAAARLAKDTADTYAVVFKEYAAQTPSLKAEVTIAVPAALPADPIRPRPALYTALAGLLGFGIASTLVWLLDRKSPRGLDERARLRAFPPSR